MFWEPRSIFLKMFYCLHKWIVFSCVVIILRQSCASVFRMVLKMSSLPLHSELFRMTWEELIVDLRFKNNCEENSERVQWVGCLPGIQMTQVLSLPSQMLSHAMPEVIPEHHQMWHSTPSKKEIMILLSYSFGGGGLRELGHTCLCV